MKKTFSFLPRSKQEILNMKKTFSFLPFKLDEGDLK